MDIIGILGLLLSVIGFGFGLYQSARAKRAEIALTQTLDRLPERLVENISRFIEGRPSEDVKEITDSTFHTQAQWADLNGDGQDELILQFPIGAHGTALQVYGKKDWSFELIAETSTDTPAGFILEDVDRDGQLEVMTAETSQALNAPYVMGLRDTVWYRLVGKEFEEVRRDGPEEDHIEEVRQMMRDDFGIH